MSKQKNLKKNKPSHLIDDMELVRSQAQIEQAVHFEKRIYDLEQLLDIAKSFSENLEINNLLEAIVYICMAQMHVLGAEIFVRDLISNDRLFLETSKTEVPKEELPSISMESSIVSKLLEFQKPITMEELKKQTKNSPDLSVIEELSPTLIVPLLQKNRLNGILVLQERIAIENDISYTDYEKELIMSIASLASVAINNASLLEKSSTDMMTHLKLKYYFFTLLTDALDTAMSQKTNLSILMFDIDFFKKFNDTYGHECGDFVLTKVAELIKGSLRENDVACRYGGEEFTVMLKGAGKEEASIVAERIRQTIDEYDFVYNDQHLHVTISGGVSVFDSSKNPVTLSNVLVNQADSVLYESKQNGRNRITVFKAKK